MWILKMCSTSSLEDPRGWCQKPRQVFIVVGVGSGILMTVHFRNLETVPYTNRTHWIQISKAMERNLGEMQFKNMKENFKGNILPPMHPESVRVKMIAKDIIHALNRGLKNEQVHNNVGYASKEVGNGNIVKAWHDEDDISYDKWVDQSKNKGQRRGSQPTTTHLNGLKWEVIVIDKPKVNAFCLPGGKIVVFTGLLQHFRSNAEIATIIGHEVAHVVARHGVEGLAKKLWLFILQFILYQSVSPNIVDTMSSLFLRLPFSRRMELEADYIGLLLIASAGFDQRVAPKVYEKLGRVNGESPGLRDYLSTHPSGKKRAELLAQAKVMDEALTIYKDTRAQRGVFKGFLY